MTQLLQLTGLTFGTILFWAYAAIAGFAALMTVVLFYHWARYNPSVISTVLVMAIYSVGVLALLLSIFGVITLL